MCRVCYGQSLSCAESNSQAAVTSGLGDLQNHDGYRGDATVGAFGAEFAMCRAGEGIKPGTNARHPEPKSEIKFCQPNMGTKNAYIKLKFTSKVDDRLFL